MTGPATNSERKRLDWPAPTGVDQTEIRINPALEARSHLQILRQIRISPYNLSESLDLGAKQRHNSEECILLDECRFQ